MSRARERRLRSFVVPTGIRSMRTPGTAGIRLRMTPISTQAFFAQLVEKHLFARADPERGRLRTFLLTAVRTYVRDEWRKQQRLKRGGGLVAFSLDEPLAEHLYGREPVDLHTP